MKTSLTVSKMGPISHVTSMNDELYVTYRNDNDDINDETFRRIKQPMGKVLFTNRNTLRLKGTDQGLLMVSANEVELKNPNGTNIKGLYTYQGVLP